MFDLELILITSPSLTAKLALDRGLFIIFSKDKDIVSLFLNSDDAKGYAFLFRPPALFMISVTSSFEFDITYSPG